MQSLTISCLKQYWTNLFKMWGSVTLECIFLAGALERFSHPTFGKIIIIIQYVVLVIITLNMTRFQILDENGITLKRTIGIKTYGLDRISSYGFYDMSKPFKESSKIQIVLDQSTSAILMDYSEEAVAWLRCRCGEPAFDKRSLSKKT